MIAYRYAKALLGVEASKEQIEKREQILSEFILLVKTVPKFRKFLLNPQISQAGKKQVLQKVVEDPQLLDFLLLILEKGKLKYLSEIATEYRKMVAEFCGKLIATLVTARGVEDALKIQIKARLEKSYEKSVIVYEKIDPQIIGGTILILDNKIIDFSIKGRIDRMKCQLLRQCDA